MVRVSEKKKKKTLLGDPSFFDLQNYPLPGK